MVAIRVMWAAGAVDRWASWAGLDKSRGEQRDHDLVMAGDGVAMTAGSCMGSFNDIYSRAIVLQEIEIHRREIGERIPEISDHGDRLQEHFRQQDGGADIEIDPAVVHLFYQRAEQPEVSMAGPSDRRARGARVRVRRIGSDRRVDCDRRRMAV